MKRGPLAAALLCSALGLSWQLLHRPFQLRRQSDGALLPRIAVPASRRPGRRAHLRLSQQRRLRRAKLPLTWRTTRSTAPISAAPFPILRCAIRGFCSRDGPPARPGPRQSGSMFLSCSATCCFWAWARTGWRNCWNAPACIRLFAALYVAGPGGHHFAGPHAGGSGRWRRWRLGFAVYLESDSDSPVEAVPRAGGRRALPRNGLPAVCRLRHPPPDICAAIARSRSSPPQYCPPCSGRYGSAAPFPAATPSDRVTLIPAVGHAASGAASAYLPVFSAGGRGHSHLTRWLQLAASSSPIVLALASLRKLGTDAVRNACFLWACFAITLPPGVYDDPLSARPHPGATAPVSVSGRWRWTRLPLLLVTPRVWLELTPQVLGILRGLV